MANVSVVIPCFNLGNYLGEAVQSCLQQNGNQEIEIIIVDDGSTDQTPQVADSFAENVSYIYQENSGLAGALNTGLEKASADHIIFLDADDRLAPNAFLFGLEQFENFPETTLVYGGFTRIDEAGKLLHGLHSQSCSEDVYKQLLRSNFIKMHSTVMYRTQTVQRIGGFETSLGACEDYEMFLKLARLDKQFIHHPGHVAEYRNYGSSMSNNSEKMLSTSLEVLDMQKSFVIGKLDLEKAWQDGEKFWTEQYGEKMKDTKIDDFDSLLKFAVEQKNTVVKEMKQISKRSPQENFSSAKLNVWRKFRKLGLIKPAPKSGQINFGDLRRTKPFNTDFGFSRGTPVDRYYIESFLATNTELISGRVLEIGDTEYTERFGSEVETAEALHISDPLADFTGDLSDSTVLPESAFDCTILTQTLHLIEDLEAAIQSTYDSLKPGGAALITVPGVTQICSDEWAKIWRSSFTQLSLSENVEKVFSAGNCKYQVFGNVLAATSLLYGISAEELETKELDILDENYPTIVTAVCIK